MNHQPLSEDEWDQLRRLVDAEPFHTELLRGLIAPGSLAGYSAQTRELARQLNDARHEQRRLRQIFQARPGLAARLVDGDTDAVDGFLDALTAPVTPIQTVTTLLGRAELAAGAVYVHDSELDGGQQVTVGDEVLVDDGEQTWRATVIARTGTRWRLMLHRADDTELLAALRRHDPLLRLGAVDQALSPEAYRAAGDFIDSVPEKSPVRQLLDLLFNEVTHGRSAIPPAENDMSASHASWQTLRDQRMQKPQAQAGYEQAGADHEDVLPVDPRPWAERVEEARKAGIILSHVECPRCHRQAEQYLMPDGEAVRCPHCGYQDAPY